MNLDDDGEWKPFGVEEWTSEWKPFGVEEWTKTI